MPGKFRTTRVQRAKLITRMPESLRVKLEAAALSNQRSLNSEIVARVEKSFDSDTIRASFPVKLKIKAIKCDLPQPNSVCFQDGYFR